MGNIETLSPFNSSDLPSFQVIDIRSEAILEAWEIQGAAFGFLYVEKAQERLFTIIFLEFILISLQSRLNNKWRTCGGAQIRPQPAALIALILDS